MSGAKREEAAFPRGFDEHRRAQASLGLRLTPAERLRWLEETMATLRRWKGRARQVAAAAPIDLAGTSAGPPGGPTPR
jgi:hypothetical protein